MANLQQQPAPVKEHLESPASAPAAQTTPSRRSWKTLGQELLFLALGGVAGTILRVVLSVVLGRWLNHGFPVDILLINISGSLALGFLAGWRDPQSRLHELLWLTLAVGFLGAYTTFSSFALGTVTLTASGHTLLGLLYLGGSFALGILAVELGLWLGAKIRK